MINVTHDKRTYLFWAAYQDNVPVMEYLLKKGAKVDITDSHQLTPLLFAAVGGRSDKAIYELLLKHGANLKDTNVDGANTLLLLLPHLKDLKEADYFVKKRTQNLLLPITKVITLFTTQQQRVIAL